MLGSAILYLKGMRILMFQLSGFHYSIVQSSAAQGQAYPYRSLIVSNSKPTTPNLYNACLSAGDIRPPPSRR